VRCLRAALLYVGSSGARNEAGELIYDRVADICRAEMHTLGEIIDALKRREAIEQRREAGGGA